jgi:RND family efflux transporter MFP subunit
MEFKMIKEYSSILSFIFLSIIVLIACTDDVKVEEVLRPVRYQEVILGSGGRLRIFTGTAKAGIESKLSFKVSGTIKAIKVKAGDVVKRGKLIASLEATDYNVKVKEAEAGLKEAESKELNAKNSYDRAKALYETNSISKSELDAARAQFESARANVERMKSGLQYARLQLSYTRLVAPIDGKIAEVPAEINENVDAGKHVLTITSQGEIKVEVSVPEVLISQIEIGTEVIITFDAIRNKNFTGKVSEVGVSTEGFSTTYPVKVSLGEADSQIRPGMAAEVRFNFSVTEEMNKIIIPPACVGEDAEGNYVFTIEPDSLGIGVASKVRVTVGELSGDGLEILYGLVDGDLIITAGVSRIQDGQKVKLLGN